MENANIKNTINIIYMVCDTLNGSYDLGKASMREIMRMDFLKFILYLGASDNEIVQEEVEFIAEYLDWNMSISQWNTFIDDQHLRSDSILSDVPLTLKIFVDADNKAYARDNSVMNACEEYISIFEMLGKAFIESDNNAEGREQIALEKYVAMMQQYYEENTKRKNASASDDGNILIKLEDRTIVISSALPETIKRMQELFPLRDELIKSLEKERDRYNPNDTFASPNKFYEKMDEVISRYNEKYENEFEKKYDTCLYFGSLSDYWVKYRDVCATASKRIANAYKQQTTMRELGHSIAESEACREIKGMSFGIITNKLSSALLYNGMAAVTYASQVKKAEQTYNKIMAKYDSDGAAKLEMQVLISEVFPLIYPVSEKCTADFFNDVMQTIDKYENIGYSSLSDEHKTSKLTSEDKYIYGDTIALRKTINELQAIGNTIDDYDKVLKKLEQCPYCPEVYIKLIKIGKFDESVFEIAKMMHIDKLILPELRKEVEKRKSNVIDVKPILKIIALYKSQSYEQILKNTYQSTINRIKEEYHQLDLLCVDNKKLDRWVIENIDSDMDKVIVTTEEYLKEKIDLLIYENIKDSEFSDLADLNLITIEDVRMNDSSMTVLDEVKKEYITKILSRVMEYIEEANRRKKIYEEAYDKFNAELKDKNVVLENVKKELKQQGLLAFSKKKEIKAEIERLERELKEFELTEPVKLKEAYYNMYS